MYLLGFCYPTAFPTIYRIFSTDFNSSCLLGSWNCRNFTRAHCHPITLRSSPRNIAGNFWSESCSTTDCKKHLWPPQPNRSNSELDARNFGDQPSFVTNLQSHHNHHFCASCACYFAGFAQEKPFWPRNACCDPEPWDGWGNGYQV